MSSLAAKIGGGSTLFVGVPVASLATYEELTETSLSEQVLSSDFQITAPTDSTSTENKKIIVASVSAGISSQQRSWSCEIIGTYSGSDDNWTSAKETLKTEIENKLNKSGKYEDKLGFVTSCSNKRIVKTESKIMSVVSVEYEKSGDTWKFKEESLKKLLSGELRDS